MKELNNTTFIEPLLQAPKFKQIRLELSNACGYNCVCCPRDKMTRKIGFMSDEDIRTIAKNFPYANEIEEVHLHGYGEPLLIKDLFHKATLVRSLFPNAKLQILSTLGYEISNDFIDNLMKSEINQLSVSFYGGNRENYAKFHGVKPECFDLAYKNLKKIAELNLLHNNKLELFFHYNNYTVVPGTDIKLPDNDILMGKLRDEFLALGFDKNRVFPLELHNYGGGRTFVEQFSPRPCSIAYGHYKRFMQISWNLNVVPCCMISNDQITLGNLNEQTVDEIFNSQEYKHFIKSHLENTLNEYPACATCQKFFDADPKDIEMLNDYMARKGR